MTKAETKITKRNHDKIAKELLAGFPAMRKLEDVLIAIEGAKTYGEAEAAVEAFLDSQHVASKIPPRYKARYAAQGDPRSCGDDFAKAFASMVTKKDAAGKQVCDLELLRQIASENDAWLPKYEALNPGMQRMNVGNRLRAKIKRGEKIWWPTKASWSA